MTETEQVVAAEEPKKKNRGLHILLGILLGTLGAVAVSYLGFSVYFIKHFAYNTTINGMDVSGYTSEMVEDEIAKLVNNYCLTIEGRLNDKDYIMGSDIEMEVLRGEGSVALLNNQNPFLWPAYGINGQELFSETLFKYNSNKLSEVFKNLNCTSVENQVLPVDAHISEYDSSKGFSVVEAVPGTALLMTDVREEVEKAVRSLATSLDLDAMEGYIEPTIFADDAKLNAQVNALNDFTKASIHYDLGDANFVLDASTYADWMSIDDDNEVSLDEEKIAEYVKEVAANYDTFGKTKYLHTSYGYNVTISKNVKYGWKLDQATEAAQIMEDLTSGQKVTRDLNWTNRAANHDGNDFGNSYVEINLTDQKLFVVDKGKVVVETNFVSGNESRGWSTPAGAFGLTYKTTDAVLRGDDYATPVKYWMPFNGNIGMHDATWRSRFGGDIYKTSGSHGCINLPKSAAAEIYGYVSTGFPVLCYHTPADTTIREAYTPYDGPDESKEPTVGEQPAE